VELTYTTNLPKEKLSFAWAAATPAALAMVPEAPEVPDPDGNGVITGTLTFHAASGNSTGKTLTRKLNITAGDIVAPVTVTQPSIDMSYGIDCASIKVYGSYMLDTYPDPDVNFITMTLTNINNNMVGAQWTLTTNTVGGVRFTGSGEFPVTDDGKMMVTLYADKTLKMTPAGEKTLTISSNSTANASCTVKITVGFKSKKVYCYSSVDNDYNYAGARSDRGAGKFLRSATCFSQPNGIMPVILNVTNCNSLSTSALNAQIQTEKPDIVIIGYNTDYGNFTYLPEYAAQGGVVIMIDENGGTAHENIIEAIFDNKVEYHTSHGHTANYSIAFKTGILTTDPLMTGVIGGRNYFGSMKTSYGNPWWGNDATATNTLQILSDASDFVVYSEADTGYYDIVRYKKKNVIYIGDGGFLSTSLSNANGSQGSDSDQSTSPCPYKINDDGTPNDDRYYGVNERHHVINSRFFANIMAWAVYQAENYGINSGGLDPFASE